MKMIPHRYSISLSIVICKSIRSTIDLSVRDCKTNKHRPHPLSFLDDNQPLFQVQATDADLGDNGLISYSILPPYENVFTINDQGQVFPSDNFNQSSSYPLRIMAMDHGTPMRLNSTYECSISATTEDEVGRLNENEHRFPKNVSSLTSHQTILQWSLSIFHQYSLLLIGFCLFFLFILLTILTICVTVCLHTCLFGHRKGFHHRKTYHCGKQFNLYDTVHRKSPFTHDDSGCSSKLDENDDLTSEERERLVNLNSDQTSCESSDSMNRQIRSNAKVRSNLIVTHERRKGLSPIDIFSRVQ